MGKGRPSKYKKQYCSDLIDHMSSGGSYDTFGALIGEKYGSEIMMSKQTLYDWEKKLAQFLKAQQGGLSLSSQEG